jgi:uncharacterized protein YndB with AHSA1/START domain
MLTSDKTKITVETTVNAPIEKVWEYWNGPEHITQWSFASDDWHTPRAENELRPGGKLKTRMESKDGKMGFDFEGEYIEVIPNRSIIYTIADGRNVKIHFNGQGDQTSITETFEAEQTHSIELQRTGWQAILDNFKNYIESH